MEVFVIEHPNVMKT